MREATIPRSAVGRTKTQLRSGAGHFLTAFNIEAFQPLAEFNARMEALPESSSERSLARGGRGKARGDDRGDRERGLQGHGESSVGWDRAPPPWATRIAVS